MKTALSRLYAVLISFENNARIVAIITMTAIIFVQVSARFIMIWSIFIGAVVSSREDNHICMGGFVRTRKGIALFKVISKIVTFLFLCVFVKWSFDYALHSYKKDMNSIVLNVPMIVVHSCFLVTGTLMALHSFVHLLRQTRDALHIFRTSAV